MTPCTGKQGFIKVDLDEWFDRAIQSRNSIIWLSQQRATVAEQRVTIAEQRATVAEQSGAFNSKRNVRESRTIELRQRWNQFHLFHLWRCDRATFL